MHQRVFLRSERNRKEIRRTISENIVYNIVNHFYKLPAENAWPVLLVNLWDSSVIQQRCSLGRESALSHGRVSPQYTFHAQGRKTWTFLPLDFNNLSKPCAVPIKLVLTFEVYSKNVWGDRYAVTGELTVVCPWEANHEQWKTNKQLKNLWLKRSE